MIYVGSDLRLWSEPRIFINQKIGMELGGKEAKFYQSLKLHQLMKKFIMSQILLYIYPLLH